MLNINADVAARELAVSLRPLKIVYISAGGGWKEGGTVVGEINMAADYTRLANRDYTGRQVRARRGMTFACVRDTLHAAALITLP